MRTIQCSLPCTLRRNTVSTMEGMSFLSHRRGSIYMSLQLGLPVEITSGISINRSRCGWCVTFTRKPRRFASLIQDAQRPVDISTGQGNGFMG
jgi:hypothetical protein